MIAGAVGVVVLAVGGFFGVKALAGGSSTTSTASQGPGGGARGNGARRGTVGTLQAIDGSTLTVATFNRDPNGNRSGGGGASAVGGTTTVTTNGSTKFYKTVSGALSDVKVGDRVTAMGTPAGDNTVTAERITDTGTMNAGGFGGPGAGDGGVRRFRNGNNPDQNGGPPSGLPNGGTRPDPVDDPLRFVPPVPVPLSCWPTVRLTAATVPSMGAVRVAPPSEDWALANWAWAAARLAWSDASWALEDPLASSLESLAVAESTLA